MRGLSALVLVSAETGEKHELLAARSDREALSDPAFSPDGKKLAFSRSGGPASSDLFVASLTFGLSLADQPIQITHDGELKHGPVSTPDSAEVIFASDSGNQSDLWRVNAREHAARRRLGVGPPAYEASVSLSGLRLVYTRGAFNLNIWRVAATSANQSTEPAMFISSTRHERSPQYSPDGKRIAFSSDRSGKYEIWVAETDGSHPLQLTAFGKGESSTPLWSPDSKRIVFDSNAETPFFQTFTIDADGGKPKRMTTGHSRMPSQVGQEMASGSISSHNEQAVQKSGRSLRKEGNLCNSLRREALHPPNRLTESGCISRPREDPPHPFAECLQKAAVRQRFSSRYNIGISP